MVTNKELERVGRMNTSSEEASNRAGEEDGVSIFLK